MNKFSQAQAGQMMKLAAEHLRALSEENQMLAAQRDEAVSKLAHYEKKEYAEKIAHLMEEKGLEPELHFQEKVAGLMRREDLSVVEEAVGMSAPQMKLASVHEDRRVTVEGGMGDENDQASLMFASNLASLA